MESIQEAVERDKGLGLKIVSGTTVDNEGYVPVMVTVQPVVGLQRSPADICCVIDISWSMSMEATIASGSATERNGMSLMDIAKHAVRTITHCLGPEDRLSLVTFCANAELVLPLTAMDDTGKEAAETAINGIGFGSDTFLWTGIAKGLDILAGSHLGRDTDQTPEDFGRFSHLMVLTDGETKDKNTIMESLQQYKREHTKLPGTINTFGFGYEIDSSLLTEISGFSEGSYAFIPDAGFVGTIFVNTMSNLLVTMGEEAVLTITGGKIDKVKGQGILASNSDGELRLKLGNLQYGQSRDVVLSMTKLEDVVGVRAYLEYTLRYSIPEPRVKIEAAAESGSASADTAAELERQRCRALFVDALAEANTQAGDRLVTDDSLARASGIVQAAVAELKASSEAASPSVAALLEDASGQSSDALSRKDYYQKWGRHYLPSIMLAHKMQQCNNFKDPGIQLYGGPLFQKLRDAADEVFCTLPPPTPTPAQWRYLGNGQMVANPDFRSASRPSGAATFSAPLSMAAYHDAHAG